ncbi:MAG: hypothetical protein M0P71_01280 [Melioribacteraceae bacterium]|nr:hypothetical protein [Melioribacteraceae bacterium]
MQREQRTQQEQRGNGSEQNGKNDFINRFWIQGVVTKNKNNNEGFEYKEFNTGNRKITFSVLVKNGENATFFRVSGWNELADSTADFMRAHMLVKIKGYLVTRRNEKTGFSEVELVATSIENARQSGGGSDNKRRDDRGNFNERNGDIPIERQRTETVRDDSGRRPGYQNRQYQSRNDSREQQIPSVDYERGPRQDTRMTKGEIDNRDFNAEEEFGDDIPF